MPEDAKKDLTVVGMRWDHAAPRKLCCLGGSLSKRSSSGAFRKNRNHTYTEAQCRRLLQLLVSRSMALRFPVSNGRRRFQGTEHS